MVSVMCVRYGHWPSLSLSLNKCQCLLQTHIADTQHTCVVFPQLIVYTIGWVFLTGGLMSEDKQAANDFIDDLNKLCDKHGLTLNVWPDGEIDIKPWASREDRWVFD